METDLTEYRDGSGATGPSRNGKRLLIRLTWVRNGAGRLVPNAVSRHRANLHHLGILTGAVAFVLLAISAVQPALARLPWAATSGLHFVDAVVAADNYWAEAGGLAMKKSPSWEVRAFGRLLWEFSIENSWQLKLVLTKTEPHTVLPTQISTHYMFAIDRLVPLSGNAFDRRFIAQQKDSLREVLALVQGYAHAGDDRDLKAFAARSVPKIKMQLDRILKIGMRHELLASR